MMTPAFELWIHGQLRYSLSFGGPPGLAESDIIAASERQWCSFRLSGRDPSYEYTLNIGDAVAEAGIIEESVEPERTVSTAVWWKEDTYLESGVGVIYATLYSRPLDSETEWTQLASLRINVLPSKLGMQRYTKMCEDVSSLSAALIFDLVSKNTRKLSFHGAGIAHEPSIVQLRRIEESWQKIEHALHRIQSSPASRFKRSRMQTTDVCLLNERSLASALARGVNPQYSAAHFAALRASETSQMYEHDLIRTFLVALNDRLAECAAYARELQEETRANYPQFFTPELTAAFVAREIAPRLTRLTEIIARCDTLNLQIRNSLSSELLRNAQLIKEFKDTPIFRSVRAYSTIFREIVEFRSKHSWTLDTGHQERIKLTSRLYEHWLFIETAAALRLLGFACISSQGFFAKGEHHKFVLDIESGTELIFRLSPRRLLRMRYEPWVLPKDQALRAGEFIFAPQRDPWHPDITLEFLRLRNDSDVEAVDYLAVLDAKYSEVPSQKQKDKVGRYSKIRSMSSRQLIAKQVWIVFPSEAPGVVSDDSVLWGKITEPEEAVEGVVGIRPHEKEQVPRTLLRFLKSLLIFRGVDDLDLDHTLWDQVIV